MLTVARIGNSWLEANTNAAGIAGPNQWPYDAQLRNGISLDGRPDYGILANTMKRLRFDPGVLSAISAGVLFGASTPLAKQLVHGIDPWMLAGWLYLGSGIGLGTYKALHYLLRARGANVASVRGADRWWLAAAITAGGILAPVLMMYGLRRTAATSASLLLNLEGVFSILIAWFVFRENFDRRIALGVVAITAGALLLSVNGGFVWTDAVGPAAIAAACLAWALDNNLTRKVALNDVTQIAMLKGLVAGSVNVAIAAALGRSMPSAVVVLAAGAVGLAGYGLSLVLFVIALRYLGTARTGAYFSIAPFMGALIAVVFFGEPVTMQLICSAALMGIGLWLHLSERHDHSHTHAPLIHNHRHVHDSHHQHDHDAAQTGAEPHAHPHRHAPLRHAHPHYPDEHHRHEH
jgi:drug/metabolite transporter (DMT)-like permease